MPATTQELKAAFHGSRLWCEGWSFDKAMSVPVVRTGLEYAAKAAQKRREQAGQKPPEQAALF